MSDTNTVTEQPKAANPIRNSKPFTKGDPRINRKGRPKSFDKLRELAVSLANETAKDGSGKPVEFEGHTATQIEMLLRVMMRENPARFVEIAFGKVPDEVKLSGEVTTNVKGYVSISPDDWDVQSATVASDSVARQERDTTVDG